MNKDIVADVSRAMNRTINTKDSGNADNGDYEEHTAKVNCIRNWSEIQSLNKEDTVHDASISRENQQYFW